MPLINVVTTHLTLPSLDSRRQINKRSRLREDDTPIYDPTLTTTTRYISTRIYVYISVCVGGGGFFSFLTSEIDAMGGREYCFAAIAPQGSARAYQRGLAYSEHYSGSVMRQQDRRLSMAAPRPHRSLPDLRVPGPFLVDENPAPKPFMTTNATFPTSRSGFTVGE